MILEVSWVSVGALSLGLSQFHGHGSWHATLKSPWPHYMILEVSWVGLGALSFGLSHFHGHGSWFVCEVALTCKPAKPPPQIAISISISAINERGWSWLDLLETILILQAPQHLFSIVSKYSCASVWAMWIKNYHSRIDPLWWSRDPFGFQAATELLNYESQAIVQRP